MRLGWKIKRIHRVLEFSQLQWLKPHIEKRGEKRNRKQHKKYKHKKGIKAEKNNGKDGKALYKLMSGTIYGKTMEMLRNRTNVK